MTAITPDQYTVYKTTNLVNGKFYFGVHKTNDPEDGYLGSGYLLLRSIAKYGRQNFKKEVLFSFSNLEQAFDKEVELIALHRNENCLNLHKGGSGNVEGKGVTEDSIRRMKESLTGRRLSSEHKRNISESLKGHLVSEETRKKKSDALIGHSTSEETKAKISEGCKGKSTGPKSEETRKRMSAAKKGFKHSEETKLRLSALAKKQHQEKRNEGGK